MMREQYDQDPVDSQVAAVVAEAAGFRFSPMLFGLLSLLVAVSMFPAGILRAQVPDGQEQRSFSSLDFYNRIGIDQKPNAQLPLELEFRDETGRPVKLREYFAEKPVILNLVYFECPMLCNRTMDGLIRTLRTMSMDVGNEFTILTVSFDPREDARLAAGAKRSALKRYGRDGAAGGWHFLTGDAASISRLTETVGFRYSYDPKLDQFAHAAGVIIATPDGRISRYLNGIEFAARDLRLSLVEASENKIGSVTDQVLLLCYQYNPEIGKYGLAIQRTIQVCGLATAMCLAAAIVIMLRRERKNRYASRRVGFQPARDGRLDE